MIVCQFQRLPVGMAWGVRLHRYTDGHAAFIVWDNESAPREVVLSVDEVCELIRVLQGTLGFADV